MIYLIHNEIIKILSRRKTYIVFLAFIALMATIVITGYKEEQRRIKMNTPEAKIEMLINSRDSLLNEKANISEAIKESPTELKAHNKNIDNKIKELDNQIQELTKMKELGINEIDWKKDVKINIAQLENGLKDNNEDISYKEETKQEIRKLKYFLDNNINPMEESKFNSFNFIKLLFNEVLGGIILAIGIILFTSDIVSGECTPPTLKFLLIQPVSRGKFLFSKFISVTSVALSLIFLAEIIFFLLVGLFIGFGNPNYPTFVGTTYKFDFAHISMGQKPNLVQILDSTKVIPIWQNTLYMFLLQALFIISCCAFAFLISSIFKSSMASMSLGIVSVLFITVLSEVVPAVRKIAYFLFTSYGRVGTLLEGTLALKFNNPSVTTSYGIMVLIIWTLICYVLSHIIFTKRDILI
ncbi:ABC transporter permease subunit [Clostridium tetanomorphum]|uniref:ABC transporter permease subunit n=1 Tax=Clostridium tetanomorphum TaxID=1553 RepID=A0A923IZM7_CLOTT|nr:ABC transporter permease [Clostridium tetanomorphum]MBC2396819.1 ABC transporter permease subunit [Clostridium tetanomorphum]NRZ97541.1 ABC-2 type transport system permease protein [Clostridium tetanomorphum]